MDMHQRIIRASVLRRQGACIDQAPDNAFSSVDSCDFGDCTLEPGQWSPRRSFAVIAGVSLALWAFILLVILRV